MSRHLSHVMPRKSLIRHHCPKCPMFHVIPSHVRARTRTCLFFSLWDMGQMGQIEGSKC